MSNLSASSSTRTIVDWNADRTNTFIDVYFENIGTRAHRIAQWYEDITVLFNERTGLDYNAKQMKNKFDNLKCEWSPWNKLLQIPGGYWNKEQDTVGGSDEW